MLHVTFFVLYSVFSLVFSYAGPKTTSKEEESSVNSIFTVEEKAGAPETLELYYGIEGLLQDAAYEESVIKIIESMNKRIEHMQDRLTLVEDSTNKILERLTKLDCYDIKVEDPLAESGVYQFYLDHRGKRPVKVYCDMITEGGGWTVIQMRRAREDVNDTEKTTMFHKRKFHDYALGFGSSDGDYWVGLENIFLWTNSRNYELRVDLQDFSDFKAHAKYSRFYLDDARDGYRIHVSGFSGNAGDSLSTDVKQDNFTADNMMFSTIDEDRDTSHEISCASYWNIGGWWFNRCSWANLNGPYKFPEEDEDCIGINWHKWRNKKCLKATKMMIRPVKIP